MNFSSLFIFPLPSREAEYSDLECGGMKLRVSKNGRRFFQHRYMLLGRKRCLSIGEFPYVSVQETRKQVREHKALLSRQIDPAEQRQKKSDISLAVFALEYYLSPSWHRTLRGESLQKKLATIFNSDYGSKHLKLSVQAGMERMPTRHNGMEWVRC